MNLRSSNLANGSGMAHCRVQPMAENFPLKGASSGSRGLFENFKLPSVFLEWMKLRTLNLASGSTTASSTRGKKSLKSVCSELRDQFLNFKPPQIFLEWMKLHSLNLAGGSTTANSTSE